MKRRHRPVNFWLITFLVMAVGAFVYLDLFVVPNTQPLFIPTSTPTRDPRSYAQEAEARFNEGKISQAMDLYQQAIRADPKNPLNYLTLARLQVYTGVYKDAQSNIETAILLNKSNPEAVAMLGWDLGYQGDYLGAKASLDKALDMDANSALIYAYYTEVLALQINDGKGELGTTTKAADYSKKALALDNSLMEVHRARGMILEFTQNFQEAANEYSQAIKMSGNIADLHISYGRTLLSMENYTKAVDEFSLAAALIPTDPLPNLYISKTYNKAGNIAKAIQYGDQALKNDPLDPNLYGNVGSLYYRNKEYDKAITNLRMAIRGGMTTDGKAIQGIPLSYELNVLIYYQRYGLALAYQNQCNEAVQISQALLQGVPNNEDAVYNANEMVKICQQNINGTPTTSPAPKANATPKP